MGQKSRKAALKNVRVFGVLPDGRAREGVDGVEESQLPEDEQAASSGNSEVESRVDEPALDEAPGGDAETLHRIRDLLFGKATQDHAERVDSLEETLTAGLGEVEQRFQAGLDAAVAGAESARAEMKTAFEAEVGVLRLELAATQAELRAAQGALDTQARGKVERSDFAAMLGELAKRVGDGEADNDS